MERRGLVTPQPQILPAAQNTPHKPTPTRRPSTSRGTPFRDEWTSAAEQGILRSQSTGPRMRGRRLSEGATGGKPSEAKAGLTIKESNVLIDRLQKENFDLKLRITLQDEKVKRISRELEDTRERIGTTDKLAERCASAEEMAAQLEQQLDEVRAQYEETWSDNQELVAMSEELVRELKERDKSIGEAAQIIYELEQKVIQLEDVATPPAKPLSRYKGSQPDSDYFSAEAESPVVAATNMKLRPSSSSSSSAIPVDSDYYSATSYSSPASAAPKRARPLSRRLKTMATDNAPAPRRRADSDRTDRTVESFDLDKELQNASQMPRRSSTAKPPPANAPSSLQPAASIQSSPDPPASRPGLRRTRRGQAAAIASLRLQVEQETGGPATPRAALHHQNAAPGSAPPPAVYAHAIAQRKMHSVTPIQHIPRASSEPPQDWTATQPRPLRSLYMTGELNRPVTSDEHNRYPVPLRAPGEAPPEATPTVLSPAATPALANDDEEDDSVAVPALSPRPIIWRDRSNMSELALAAANTGLQQGFLQDDQLSIDSGSPTPTIPETISSQVDLAARRAQRLSELGSEYSGASTVRDVGSSSGWPPPRDGRLFGRDVLFRP